MTDKIIALFSNIAEFEQGPLAWNNKRVTDKYPGSRWVHYLDKFASKEGIQVMDGIEVARTIARNEGPDPKDVFVVQEEINAIGSWLIKQGAHASVVVCLESPLYTPLFYNSIEEMKGTFKAQVLFGELGTHPVHFPSFDENQLAEIPKWEDRTKYSCMVMSNKPYQANDPAELITFRYKYIETFKKTLSCDLYGKGWPTGYATEIAPGYKIEVIKNYKWNICLENYQMKGYLTEKLIECFEAGCIPYYLGATDITKLIPGECFSDPLAGRQFLESSLGKKYSYQSFARQVLGVILS